MENNRGKEKEREEREWGGGINICNFAYFVKVREGPENSAEPNFKIQADTYKLILTERAVFTHNMCIVGKKITRINIICQ